MKIKSRYTRSDPRGSFPERVGVPELECNRLALVWRPIIDLTDSPFAPMRLRFAAPVAAWLADPPDGHRLWFSRIGVPGLRSQVLRHAGLTQWDCRSPEQLPEHMWTPAWRRLVEAIAAYPDLDDTRRTLVVFQLVQLSFVQHAADLAAGAHPTGDPSHDWYVITAARVTARLPARLADATALLERMALDSSDHQIALAAAYQALGYLRHLGGSSTDASARAARVEQRARQLETVDDFDGALLWTRFHRALALSRVTGGEGDAATAQLHEAWARHDLLAARATNPIHHGLAAENETLLLDAELALAAYGHAPHAAAVRTICARLIALDPCSVEAHLTAGDAFAGIGDLRAAVDRYRTAARFETASGALAWYRAAGCLDLLGERAQAADAMAACLELDASALEPRQYLECC